MIEYIQDAVNDYETLGGGKILDCYHIVVESILEFISKIDYISGRLSLYQAAHMLF